MQHKTATNILQYGECLCLRHCKHLYSWGRITQTIGIPSKIQKMSQWNRCSIYLRNCYPNNQMRSMEWKQLTGKALHGSICLWLVLNKWSVFSAQKSIFSDSVLCLGKMNENPQSNMAWEDRLTWFKSSPEYRALDRIDGEPIEFEWYIFPGFTTLQLSHKVQELLLRLSVTPENFYRTNYHHVDVQRHLMGIKGQQERKRVKCSTRFSFCKEIRSRTMVWIREKVVFFQVKIVHKVNGTKWLTRWWWHPVFRATSPLSRWVLKSKGCGKLSIHCCADPGTIVFRTITSVNRLCLYGAVAEMCGEYESYHDRMGGPVVRGQFFLVCQNFSWLE